MKLNNYTEYAFRVLIYLLMNKSERVKVRDIADYFTISTHHLNKVVQKLSKHELVKTMRGKHGGIMITEKGELLHVDELIKLLEPREEVAQCLGSKNLVPCALAESCKLRGIFSGAKQDFYSHLRQYQIKDLV